MRQMKKVRNDMDDFRRFDQYFSITQQKPLSRTRVRQEPHPPLFALELEPSFCFRSIPLIFPRLVVEPFSNSLIANPWNANEEIQNLDAGNKKPWVFFLRIPRA